MDFRSQRRSLFRGRFSSPLLRLIDEVIDRRGTQDALPLCRVIPVSWIELLKKPGHADRSQGFDERVDSDSPQLGRGRASAVNSLYCCVHGTTASEYHFAGFSTCAASRAASRSARPRRRSSVVNSTCAPALSAQARCRASKAAKPRAFSSRPRCRSRSPAATFDVAQLKSISTLRRRSVSGLRLDSRSRISLPIHFSSPCLASSISPRTASASSRTRAWCWSSNGRLRQQRSRYTVRIRALPMGMPMVQVADEIIPVAQAPCRTLAPREYHQR